jgi:hypothetical protein
VVAGAEKLKTSFDNNSPSKDILGKLSLFELQVRIDTE